MCWHVPSKTCETHLQCGCVFKISESIWCFQSVFSHSQRHDTPWWMPNTPTRMHIWKSWWCYHDIFFHCVQKLFNNATHIIVYSSIRGSSTASLCTEQLIQPAGLNELRAPQKIDNVYCIYIYFRYKDTFVNIHIHIYAIYIFQYKAGHYIYIHIFRHTPLPLVPGVSREFPPGYVPCHPWIIFFRPCVSWRVWLVWWIRWAMPPHFSKKWNLSAFDIWKLMSPVSWRGIFPGNEFRICLKDDFFSIVWVLMLVFWWGSWWLVCRTTRSGDMFW